MGVRAIPALVTYALMLAGLRVFVLEQEGIVWWRGAQFGFILYGVYSGTCMTILDEWDVGVAIYDSLWGAFMYSVAAHIGS